MKMNLQYFAEDRFTYTFDKNGTSRLLATKDTQVDKDIEIKVTIPTQSKSITVTENKSEYVYPDTGKLLSYVRVTTNVKSYITVASEADLPSTAQEGTIAVVEGVAMYSVSVSEFNRISAPTQFYYSIDNGMNWVEITGTGLLTSEATQLKFRITYEGEEIQPSGSISSVQAGISASYSIHDTGYQFADKQSENVTLTQNITDIRCR